MTDMGGNMELKKGSPEEAGLDAGRLSRAYELVERWVAEDRVAGAAMAVARHGVLVEPRGFGRSPGVLGSEPTAADSVFLVASVTKPVTATAAMLLVERGELSLQDPVCQIVPGFGERGKDEVRVLHLLTHTSGLPDMLPDNVELRQRHAPLSEFVAGICRCGLLFRPGTQIRYQSMGTAMLGEIVERLTGMPLREFVRRELFLPLGMTGTALGLSPDLAGRVSQVRVPAQQWSTDWHWNSPYWQGFGAPWGGMFATVQDLAVFLQMILQSGRYGGRQVLGAATAGAMVTDQTSRMPGLSAETRLSQAWGLGWRLGGWGDLGSPRSFWHNGATGTQVGADPDTGLVCAVFTTQPDAPLHCVVNAVKGALV